MASNKFFNEVGKIKEVKEFKGGVASQREHLNEVVKALNQIVQEAKRCTDPKSLPDLQRVLITVNGGVQPVNIPLEFTQ